MQDNFFDAPPEGAIPQGAIPRGFERPPQLQYKAGMVEENFLKYANDDFLAENIKSGKIGFRYYDKEEKQTVSLADLSFVVLEVYAGVSGFDGQNNYTSSRSRDTRKEPLTVWKRGEKSPILSGLYVGKKGAGTVATIGGQPLPESANFTPFIKAYCLELDQVVEIEVSAMCQNGLKKAIAASDKKPDTWQRIFFLGLSSTDHFWGFRLIGYTRVDKEGQPHSGKGKMFYEPAFTARILNPVTHPELHAKCVQLQNEERAMHAAYLDRNAQYQPQTPAPATESTPTPAPQYTTEPITSTTASPAASRMEPAEFDVPTAPANPAMAAMAAPMPDEDDLPF